jgi:tetratricopeptide (TPR) repeat protein
MKRSIYIFLFFVFIACRIFADNNSTIISKANQEYAKGEYFNSIELYKNVIKNGFESADLYYNLGNAYFKVNDFSSAMLYFEKARKLNPGDDNINFNIKLTGTKIPDKIEPVPVIFFKRFWIQLSEMFSADFWAILTIAFFTIFFILTGFYLLSRTILIRKIAFWTGTFFLFITLLSFALGNYQYQNVISNKDAIVMNPSVTIKSSPNENSTDLFVIHEGTKVKITDEVGDWSEVSIANGSRGWMKTSSFEKI